MLIRLIQDEPARGSLNMAVDQALLASAADSGVATLRIYGWQPATLSLGYFQSLASRDTHQASAGCPVVRRASGGGAILHDREITYSVALPWSRRSASNRLLFDQVHRTLINSLAYFGVTGCRVFSEASQLATSGEQAGEKPFLCFQRRSSGDVILGEHKIIGSAQRRARGALLQHGSLLLARSRNAPELPGVHDLGDMVVFASEDYARHWINSVAATLGWQLQPGNLTNQEIESAAKIEIETFDNENWTCKR